LKTNAKMPGAQQDNSEFDNPGSSEKLAASEAALAGTVRSAAELAAALHATQSELAAANAQLAKAEEAIAAVNEIAEAAQATIDKLRAEVAARDAEVSVREHETNGKLRDRHGRTRVEHDRDLRPPLNAPPGASTEVPVSWLAGSWRLKRVVRMARAAARLGQWRLAVQHYQTVLARNPNDALIWVQYGHALKESGSAAEAERAYLRAIDLDPSAADPYLQLGHALKIQRRRREAAMAYRRALDLDPTLHAASVELTALGWRSDS
jgi:tetratricopeptide (TPR) repeat protein